MAIRVQKDPMGMGGRAWYASTAADLAALPREAADLVPARAADLFRGAPESIRQLAGEAPLPGMRRWLSSLGEARCELEIYATRHCGREARLRFHFASGWAPSFRGATLKAAAPCPEIVEQVHAVTGAIDYHFGGSGTLVALDELETLRALVRGQKVMSFDEIESALGARPELGSYVGVYEKDGDWLCVDTAGHTLWTGGEWLDGSLVEPAADITQVLDRFFEDLAEQRYFIPGTC